MKTLRVMENPQRITKQMDKQSTGNKKAIIYLSINVFLMIEDDIMSLQQLTPLVMVLY